MERIKRRFCCRIAGQVSIVLLATLIAPGCSIKKLAFNAVADAFAESGNSYAGDNDIASGKSPEAVCGSFKLFVQKIHGALPRCRIVFIAIKPSIRRWALVGKMREANRLIEALTRTDARLAYVDIDTPMIGRTRRVQSS